MDADPYANLSSATFSVMGQFIRNRERHSLPLEMADVKKCGAFETEPRSAENTVRFWADAFGQSGYARNNGSQNGYDLTAWGGSVGVVKQFSTLYGGLTIGYARTRSTWDDLPSVGKSNSYMAEALLGLRLGNNYFIEGYFDYAYNDQKMNRMVNFGRGYYQGRAKGDVKDHLFAGGIRLGYQCRFLDTSVFAATIGAQVMHSANNSFTEYGTENMAPLFYVANGWMDRTVFMTPVTVSLRRSFTLGDSILTPRIRAGFTPWFGDRQGLAKAEWRNPTFPGRVFTSRSTTHGKYEAQLGVTLELSRRGRFSMAGSYDLFYSRNSFLHHYSLQASLKF
ncbi:MAG: autotransporter outer membrane beta-barrel domain-containing protein [Planctomycetaceae bacterium]|nr:autotransporter outer membrane beta-barrel domain-containing protein [Planctomycetaceae bacterium]